VFAENILTANRHIKDKQVFKITKEKLATLSSKKRIVMLT